MAEAIRVVHYLNQFFGGIGGEDKANTPPEIRRGPVGAGRALQAALGQDGVVESTVICGDNYFVDEQERATEALSRILSRENPDLVIAGPAFDAGRYGYACANFSMLAKKLGIPAVTGMHSENPGYTTFASQLVCVSTGTSSNDMRNALDRMVPLGLKLARGEQLGSRRPTAICRPASECTRYGVSPHGSAPSACWRRAWQTCRGPLKFWRSATKTYRFALSQGTLPRSSWAL